MLCTWAWKYKKHPLLPYCLHCWTVNHIFFNFPFASSVRKEALLISYQFQLQLSFGFPNCFCLLGLCLYISAGQPILTSTSVCVWHQSGVPQSSVLGFCHACCNFCLSERTDFFTLTRLSLKIKQHTWVPLGDQNFPCEILLRHSLNKLKYVDLKVQGSVLYMFLRIFNATILCLLQPRHSCSPPILPC